MNTASTPTPMFEHPLHALLTDLGFADGDAAFDITEQDGTTTVALRAPTGYTLEIPLPHATVPDTQLTTVRDELDMFLMEVDDLDEAVEQATELGCDNPREWRDMMSATCMWVETQVACIDKNGDALCKLMRLDPYALSREDFLRGMWRSMLSGGSGVLFTLLDEYLKVNDLPFTGTPTIGDGRNPTRRRSLNHMDTSQLDRL